MIRETEVRIVGLGVMLAAALFAVGGCNPASPGSAKAPNINGGTDNPGGGTRVVRPPAFEFLAGFIKTLAEGKAGPDSFTSAFKSKIARPKFKNEEHEKLGYDPDRFDAFLKRAALGSYDGIEDLPASSGTYFASMGKLAGKTENCLIRLVPTEDAAGWRIDWLQRTTTTAPPFRDAALQAQQSDARIAAIAFLSTMLDSQYDLAEALMTKNYKCDLAFSTTDSNQKLGYDPGLLQNVKLKDWKSNFVEFTIAKQEIVEGKPALIGGELFDADKRTHQPFTLTLVKEANGEWLVDKFEAKQEKKQ